MSNVTTVGVSLLQASAGPPESRIMVSEFDLPCTDCDRELVRATVERPGGAELTVAECPTCGGRYYPESALDRV